MSRRVLAVDDEPDMLVLLQRIIQDKTPYEIVTTNTALEVPQLLDRYEFDVIITDLSMPKLDGLDILRMVNARNKGELVILITAFGDYETSEEARRLGVFDYIHKPFRKDQILTTLERAMERRTGRETDV